MEKINEITGRLESGETTVSNLIDYLTSHKDAFGDTAVLFTVEGEDVKSIKFDHYINAIRIDVTPDEDSW